MNKYLVIGNPIEHSLSPKLHNYWFRENNIEANYDKKKLDEKSTGNENRTHTPPSPACRRHRAFDDGAAAASTRASPALALNITFHIKPMAHV